MTNQSERQKSRRAVLAMQAVLAMALIVATAVAALLGAGILFPIRDSRLAIRGVYAAAAGGAGAANVIYRPGVIVDNPTVTIASATTTTTATSTTAAREAHVTWKFGTVTGTYSTCTAQAQTSYDGSNFVSLGGTAALTVTTNTANTWDVYQQAPATTGVTVTTPSATAGTGFGQLTQFVFACTTYGTSAPVTITVIYR